MANRFWFGGSGNWTDTAHWGTASNGVGPGASVPGTGDTALFDANSGAGTCTVNATVNLGGIGGLNLSNYTGTVDFGANNVTIGSTGVLATAGTFTLTMGSGTWTFNAGGAGGTILWNFPATATLSANTATMNFSITNANNGIRLGTKTTYNVINISGGGKWDFQSAGGTISTLTIAAGTRTCFSGGFTFVISNAPTLTGTRTNPIELCASAGIGANAGIISVPSGTVTLDWGIIDQITATGGATFNATNTVTYSTTTGWSSITAPPASSGSAGVIGG